MIRYEDGVSGNYANSVIVCLRGENSGSKLSHASHAHKDIRSPPQNKDPRSLDIMSAIPLSIAEQTMHILSIDRLSIEMEDIIDSPP